MRPSNKSRSRNKSGNSNNRRNVGNIVNRVFESAGPDGKVRGTPQQIIDKYHALARDAQVSGDRVAAESFQQHAEHYTRLLGESLRQFSEARGEDREERDDGQQPRETQAAPQQRDGGGRDGGGREGGGRDAARDAGAFEGQQGERAPRRETESQRQSEPAGLTTIGADDGDIAGGPVDTPEEAAARARAGGGGDPRDIAAEGQAVNGEHRAAEDEAAAPPAKRPRTRRKKPAEPQPAEAAE